MYGGSQATKSRGGETHPLNALNYLNSLNPQHSTLEPLLPLIELVFLFKATIQQLVLIGQIDLATLNECLRYIAALHIQNIAFTHHDVGILAHFDAARTIGHAHDLGRIQGDGR